MELNYHHLRYFHAVAQLGSIAAASKQLLVAKATISGQIKQLEATINGELFERNGRELVLTQLGQQIFHYADDIFRIGHELEQSISNGRSKRAPTLRIGVTNAVAKSVAYNILVPTLETVDDSCLTVVENETAQLLDLFSLNHLDLILSDCPMPPGSDLPHQEKYLGSSAVGIFAAAPLVESLRAGFPESLDGAPFLASTESSAVGKEIDGWLRRRELNPRIIGRFENSALIKSFAMNGHGCFAAPMTASVHLNQTYQLRCIGYLPDVIEHYYAIYTDSRMRHPGIDKLIFNARQTLQQDA